LNKGGKAVKRRSASSSATRTILILIIFIAFCSVVLSGGKTYSKYLFNRDYDLTIGSSDKFLLTDISDILAVDGVKVTKTLTAGAVTPSAAGPTTTYQWFKSITPDVENSYSEITGANANTYTLVQDDYGYYIKVQATGDNENYYGDVRSHYVGPVEAAPATQLQSVTLSGGSNPPQINNILAPTVLPAGATVTCQWYRSLNGTSLDTLVSASSTYQITTSDFGYYIIVQVTGYGSYAGTKATATSAAVGKIPVTAVGLTGTLQLGQVLTATSSPSGATMTYAWYRSTDGTAWGSAIATTATYTLVAADINNYVKLVIMGTGDYTGTAQTVTATKVAKIPLTSVSISGTLQVKQTLSAASLTPSAATVTYAWYRSTDGSSWGSPISTTNTYTLASADIDNYIELVVTGTGNYTGTAQTVTTTKVTRIPVTAVTLSDYDPSLQDLLTTTITPIAATVTYQWYSAASLTGAWTAISGATSSSYSVVTTDCGKYIKVIVTGTGDYTGTSEAVSTSAVARIPITAVTITGATSNAAAKHSTLTAVVTPSDASVTYQWYVSSTNSNTAGSAISGATSSTFTIPASTTYYSKFVYVIVTAISASQYTGSASSTCASIGASTKSGLTSVTTAGTLRIGQSQTSTTKTNTTTVTTGLTYQWQRSTDGITYTAISGATSKNYTLATADNHCWVRIMVTGTGTTYVGTVYSTPIGVNTIKLGSYSPYVGTAVTATVSRITSGTGSTTISSYKWQRCLTASGTFTNISGATSSSYTPVTADAGYYLRACAVLADGTTVYDTTTDPVQSATIAITGVTVSPFNALANTTMTATVTPTGAVATYVWSCTNNGGKTWVQVSSDPSSSTYTVTQADYDTYNYIRVVVTANSPGYTGSATSSNTQMW
jgi:hypothetical protein